MRFQKVEFVVLNMISKFCKRCNKETERRLIKSAKRQYYSCKICLENNCKTHRKKHWFRYLAQKANTRKVSNSTKITEDHIKTIWNKQNNKCALTGQSLYIENKWWKPSLDRIDSNKGYTLDNIRIVAWIVNHSRGELTDDEFINMCIKIVDNHKTN